jgi:hypothetical protein
VPENGQGDGGAPIKKRRLVNGQELVFRKPGEESDGEDEEEEVGPQVPALGASSTTVESETVAEVPQILDAPRITIHDD